MIESPRFKTNDRWDKIKRRLFYQSYFTFALLKRSLGELYAVKYEEILDLLFSPLTTKFVNRKEVIPVIEIVAM